MRALVCACQCEYSSTWRITACSTARARPPPKKSTPAARDRMRSNEKRPGPCERHWLVKRPKCPIACGFHSNASQTRVCWLECLFACLPHPPRSLRSRSVFKNSYNNARHFCARSGLLLCPCCCSLFVNSFNWVIDAAAGSTNRDGAVRAGKGARYEAHVRMNAA